MFAASCGTAWTLLSQSPRTLDPQRITKHRAKIAKGSREANVVTPWQRRKRAKVRTLTRSRDVQVCSSHFMLVSFCMFLWRYKNKRADLHLTCTWHTWLLTYCQKDGGFQSLRLMLVRQEDAIFTWFGTSDLACVLVPLVPPHFESNERPVRTDRSEDNQNIEKPLEVGIEQSPKPINQWTKIMISPASRCLSRGIAVLCSSSNQMDLRRRFRRGTICISFTSTLAQDLGLPQIWDKYIYKNHQHNTIE